MAGNVDVKKQIKFNANGSIELTDDLTGATPDEMVTDYKRVYPMADKFAHASGYLGELSDGEVGTIDPNCPEKGPRISAERWWEEPDSRKNINVSCREFRVKS